MSLFSFFTRQAPRPAAPPHTTPPPRPAPHPAPEASPGSLRQPGPAHQLAISKIFAQIKLIEQTYQIQVIKDDGDRQKIMEDLAWMLANDDLTKVSVELHRGSGPDRVTAASFEWTPAADLKPGQRTKSEGGFELPLLPAHKLTGQRMTVSNGIRHAAQLALYKPKLHRNWSTAEHIPSDTGSSFNSSHVAASSQGRLSGKVSVTDAARCRVQVITTGTQGYAFAWDIDKGERVFLHPRHLGPGAQLVPGAFLTCLCVTTPKGTQGRDIRLPEA